jgi:anti-sigma B factor antagonist
MAGWAAEVVLRAVGVAMFLVKDLDVSLVNHFSGQEIAEIEVTYADDLVTVIVAGELDVSNTAWLHDTLHDAIDTEAAEVVLDVGGLTFMDSTGLVVLQGARVRMQSTGRTLTIRHPTPHMMRLLEATELVSLLTIRRLLL